MIDVHVLLLPSTDRDLWMQCQQSLHDEPIALHLVEGVQGHIGEGRFAGFHMGASPYVSYVDPDDVVIPGGFAACMRALEQNPHACGAYTDELIIGADSTVIKAGIWSGLDWNPLLQLEPKYLHHICVMRRCFVERCSLELLNWHSMPEYVLKCMLTRFGPWIHVDQFGYKWRLRKNSAHRAITPKAICAAQWRVIPILQKAAEKYQAVILNDSF